MERLRSMRAGVSVGMRTDADRWLTRLVTASLAISVLARAPKATLNAALYPA
jgi:hypothetical protein